MHRLYVLLPLIATALASAASASAPDDRSENEKAAITALRTIQAAQYYSQFGHYATLRANMSETLLVA